VVSPVSKPGLVTKLGVQPACTTSEAAVVILRRAQGGRLYIYIYIYI
jgi:hypothetical protein